MTSEQFSGRLLVTMKFKKQINFKNAATHIYSENPDYNELQSIHLDPASNG